MYIYVYIKMSVYIYKIKLSKKITNKAISTSNNINLWSNFISARIHYNDKDKDNNNENNINKYFYGQDNM